MPTIYPHRHWSYVEPTSLTYTAEDVESLYEYYLDLDIARARNNASLQSTPRGNSLKEVMR